MLIKFSCMLIDVINDTLAACDYRNCNKICMTYLMSIVKECPDVFNHDRYLELWRSLFEICASIGEQTSPFYLDK